MDKYINHSRDHLEVIKTSINQMCLVDSQDVFVQENITLLNEMESDIYYLWSNADM